MQSMVKSMSPYEWLLLIMLSILWGGSFFFVGVAVEVLPPLTIVILRVFGAAIALLAVVYFTGLRMPSNPTVVFLEYVIIFAGEKSGLTPTSGISTLVA